jgi:hypothetical protein
MELSTRSNTAHIGIAATFHKTNYPPFCAAGPRRVARPFHGPRAGETRPRHQLLSFAHPIRPRCPPDKFVARFGGRYIPPSRTSRREGVSSAPPSRSQPFETRHKLCEYRSAARGGRTARLPLRPLGRAAAHIAGRRRRRCRASSRSCADGESSP